MDCLTRYYPIHDKQHGFRKGRSTESAISNTVNYIEKQLLQKKTYVGVFLDISSAYDSIHIDHIRESLYKFGGDTDLVEWYYHYLSHRILKLELHGDMINLHNAVGFPQGGVASAKFWLLAFDPAINIINTHFVEGNGYADDCCIVFGGRKPKIIIRRLQRVVDKLIEWGNTCGLKFNPEKTVVVNFSRKIKPQLIPHLRISGEYIPFSKTAVYLGITLDSKLFWRQHIQDRITRGKKYLMKMNNISKAIWGPKPKLSRWVYRCVVRPMIVYSSVIWTHAVDSPGILKKLRSLNRLGISTYTMFPRSTPTRSVELLTDTFPLHLWLEKEAICAFIRLNKLMPLDWIGRNNNKRHNTSHRRYWAERIEEYGLSELLLELDICYEVMTDKKFQVHTESFAQPTVIFEDRELEPLWKIYTDGSKLNDKVGAAYVIYKGEMEFEVAKFRLPNSATVFQAELYAIYHGAMALKEYVLEENNKVAFFSDSMASLQALNATEIVNSIVRRTILQLNNLYDIGYEVHLYWVKAHIGILGNERADVLAKQSTEMETITYTPLPRSQVRLKVLEAVRKKWKTQWEEYDEARHSKIFIHESDKKRGREICSLNRIDLRHIIMAITNHNNLKYHQNLHDDTINPTCHFCRLFDETFDHFFTCNFFREARDNLRIVWPFSVENPWKVEQIMAFIKDTPIGKIIDHRQLVPIRTSEERLPEEDVEMESNSDTSSVNLGEEL